MSQRRPRFLKAKRGHLLAPFIVAPPARNIHATAVEAKVSATISDSSLLARVHRGDEAALAHLYDSYSKLVFSVALRVLHNRSAAEDVLQDVFLRIWRHPASFVAARGSLGGWLSVIARNRAIDVLRQKRPAESIEDLPLIWPGNVLADVELTMLSAKVKELIATLSLAQQQVLELAYFKGWTHIQIAENTQTPLGTVKTRIRSALLALRQGMQSTISGSKGANRANPSCQSQR